MLFAERVRARYRREKLLGVRADENTVIRVQPMFTPWKLAKR